MLRIILVALFAIAGLTAAARAQPSPARPAIEEAVFAGGCFWCTEADFEKMPGVISAVSGYTGGWLANPTYEQVSYAQTGHYEAVLVRFDPAKITYAQLVENFWPTIDPLDANGQFCDKGSSYRTAIFVTPAQQPIAEASKARLAASGVLAGPIATQILERKTFYPAEEYHQDYAKKNPIQYNYYRTGCRRDARLRQVWETSAAK